MTRFLVAALSLAGLPCCAQELPDKPEPNVTVPVYYSNPHQVERQVIPVPHKTVDSAFVEVNTGMFLVSAADSALALTHSRYEVNPLVRKHPIVTTVAGLGGAVFVTWLDHKWKRQDDAMKSSGISMDPRGDHRWWAFPALVMGIRGAGLLSGLVAIR